MPTLPIYNKCNNNCIMCSNQSDCCNLNKEYFSLPYLFERIERFRKGDEEFLDDYRDAFCITGGEPTLHQGLISLINKINNFFPGIKITVLTNGRMFFYECYAKEILKLDIDLELSISIHGHNSNIHDRITRTKNSFVQTIKGLENILRFKKTSQNIEIRVVIHRLNHKFLKNIIKFIKHNFSQIDRLVFIFMELEGQAVKNFKILKLTYNQLLPYIREIYDLVDNFCDTRFYHFPLCALPQKFFPYIWRTLPASEVCFLKICNGCDFKEFCLGIHKGYLKYIGNSEFRPVKKNINFKKSTSWHHPILEITS